MKKKYTFLYDNIFGIILDSNKGQSIERKKIPFTAMVHFYI